MMLAIFPLHSIAICLMGPDEYRTTKWSEVLVVGYTHNHCIEQAV